MSEINTKIFKPQKWVLDVLNSPKGETIEFGDFGNLIKISDKVPEDMSKEMYLYLYAEEIVSLSGVILTEIDPSIYITEGLLIFTDDIEGISKGIYFNEEIYEGFKEGGVTESYLIFQTNQDFSISKKTIEGEVHPIENKYIPGGGSEIIYLHFNEEGSIPYKDKEQTIKYTKEELMSLNNEIINNPAKDVKIIITDMNYVDFYGACDKYLDTTTVVLHFSGIWRDNDDNSYKRALFSNIVRNGSEGSGSNLTLIEIYLDEFSISGVNQSFYNIPLNSCMEWM